jgi:hypothetical protein
MLFRIELSRRLLSLLTTQQERWWHDTVTLDESWFDLNTDHELIWLRADEKVPERERHTVHSDKLRFTILWNPNGFHLINVPSKGIKFNTSHYTTLLISLCHCENGAKLRSVETIENWRSMPMIHTRIRREWSWNFWSRTGWKQHHTHYIHLIWRLLLLTLRPHQATLGRTRILWSGSTSRGSWTHSGGHWISYLRSGFSRLDGETRAMYHNEWRVRPVKNNWC